MKRSINIPLGATVRVTREDGRFEFFVFRGADNQGVIYEDVQGGRHADLGVYTEIAIKEGAAWKAL